MSATNISVATKVLLVMSFSLMENLSLLLASSRGSQLISYNTRIWGVCECKAAQMNERTNTPTAEEYNLLQSWARFQQKKQVGGCCVRVLMALKGPKGGMSDGLFPFWGQLGQKCISSEVFLPSRNIPPQIMTSADLCSSDYQDETQESRSRIPGSFLMALWVVAGALPQPPSCWHSSATAR